MEFSNAIRENGWRQGAFLPPSLAADLRKNFSVGAEWTEALVVSQDCDLLHRSLEAEPFAEIIWLKRLNKIDRQFRDGKSFRKLHLEARAGGKPAYFEVVPFQRHQLDRRALSEHRAAENLKLSGPVRHTLVSWLAQRYTRTAFPDAFCERLDAARRDLEKHLKKVAWLIERILLAVKPMDEVADTEVYEVDLLVVGDRAAWEDAAHQQEVRKTAGVIRNAFEACEGIEVTDFSVASSDQIPLSALEFYHSWDVFTYLTHRETLQAADDPN